MMLWSYFAFQGILRRADGAYVYAGSAREEIEAVGKFLNPGNQAFRDVLNSDIYVDKTELLDYINSVIDTTSKFICNSRPRRFGKSITADMMTAYYSRGCNSEEMFSDLKIADRLSFRENLNRYDVIHLDVQWCMLDAGSAERTVEYINQHILDELRMEYPSSIPESVQTAYGAMSCVYAAEGKLTYQEIKNTVRS